MRKGSVLWFDVLSGTGVVREDETGICYKLHFSAIEGVDKNNYAWPADKDREFLHSVSGKPCSFEILNDPDYLVVSKCKIG